MVGNFHNHKIYGTIESKVPSQLCSTVAKFCSEFVFSEPKIVFVGKKSHTFSFGWVVIWYYFPVICTTRSCAEDQILENKNLRRWVLYICTEG